MSGPVSTVLLDRFLYQKACFHKNEGLMMLKIKLFPAEHGDSIMISVENESEYNILIDGGVTSTYRNYIKQEICRIIKIVNVLFVLSSIWLYFTCRRLCTFVS